jgi:hypothetical protein
MCMRIYFAPALIAGADALRESLSLFWCTSAAEYKIVYMHYVKGDRARRRAFCKSLLISHRRPWPLSSFFNSARSSFRHLVPDLEI